MRTWVGVAVVLCALGTGCASEWELPDESDPQVQQEKARVAELLEDTGAVLGEPGGRCDARVLGMEGDTSYAWAKCQVRTDGVTSAASLPVRVDGEDVRQPEDGSGNSDSVRELFPPGLAKAINDREERLLP